MPMIGSPNTHARNHRLPRSFRATLRKIAHLMIRCTTGDPLLFRMTRNSRLMLSILVGLSPSLARKLTLYCGQGAGFASPTATDILSASCPCLSYPRYASEGQTGRLASSYSPNVLEVGFSEVELPIYGVLRSFRLRASVNRLATFYT